MIKRFHLEILPDHQRLLFKMFAEQEWISSFYLAGGTALALQIGHRQSVDFDFFIKTDFTTADIIHILQDLGEFELFSESWNTINGLLNNVRVSFFSYRYPLLCDLHTYLNISVAGMEDIAAMKLEAVSGRGSRKDFIDMFYLLDCLSISEMFEKHKKKYGIKVPNNYHLLKSLVYFEDAEREPMPHMLYSVLWDDVKKRMISEVRKFTEDF